MSMYITHAQVEVEVGNVLLELLYIDNCMSRLEIKPNCKATRWQWFSVIDLKMANY